MIVLDEQLSREDLRREFGWYAGRVVFLRELRPATIVKDDAVPALLHRARQATFVTINVTDFWSRVAADRSYRVVCLAVPDERTYTIPGILRMLFHQPYLRTRAQRMGKVVLVSGGRLRC